MKRSIAVSAPNEAPMTKNVARLLRSSFVLRHSGFVILAGQAQLTIIPSQPLELSYLRVRNGALLF